MPPDQGRFQKVLLGGCSFELGWMLTEYKDVKPEKERKQALFKKCVHVKGVYSKLSSTKFWHFLGVFFLAKLSLKQIGKQK